MKFVSLSDMSLKFGSQMQQGRFTTYKLNEAEIGLKLFRYCQPLLPFAIISSRTGKRTIGFDRCEQKIGRAWKLVVRVRKGTIFSFKETLPWSLFVPEKIFSFPFPVGTEHIPFLNPFLYPFSSGTDLLNPECYFFSVPKIVPFRILLAVILAMGCLRANVGFNCGRFCNPGRKWGTL